LVAGVVCLGGGVESKKGRGRGCIGGLGEGGGGGEEVMPITFLFRLTHRV